MINREDCQAAKRCGVAARLAFAIEGRFRRDPATIPARRSGRHFLSCSAAAARPPARSSIRSATSRAISTRRERRGCNFAMSSTRTFMPITCPRGGRSPRRPGPNTSSSPTRPRRGGFRKVRHGDVLDLGNVSVEALHTPGHTPEHICLLVTDRHTLARAVVRRHRPHVDGGRRRAHRTRREAPKRGRANCFAACARLKALPDYLEVLPGALAGSVCGRGLSGNPMSTIGFERRNNAAFRIDDEERVRGPYAQRHSAASAPRGRVPGRQRRSRDGAVAAALPAA